MNHTTHYQALINRGRKAGLNTRDLYSAMASVPVEGNVRCPGQADGNGYVSRLMQRGHCVYQPLEGHPRS